jgi:hypothetical protein
MPPEVTCAPGALWRREKVEPWSSVTCCSCCCFQLLRLSTYRLSKLRRCRRTPRTRRKLRCQGANCARSQGTACTPTSMRQANSAATGWTDQVSARGAAARVKLRAPCPTTPATAARAKPKLRRLRLQQVGGRYSAPSLCCSARPRSSGACVLAAEPTGTQLCPSRP